MTKDGISRPAERCFRYDASHATSGLEVLRPKFMHNGQSPENNEDMRFGHYCYVEQNRGVKPPAMDITAFRRLSHEAQLKAGKGAQREGAYPEMRARASATFQGLGAVDMSPLDEL